MILASKPAASKKRFSQPFLIGFIELKQQCSPDARKTSVAILRTQTAAQEMLFRNTASGQEVNRESICPIQETHATPEGLVSNQPSSQKEALRYPPPISR